MALRRVWQPLLRLEYRSVQQLPLAGSHNQEQQSPAHCPYSTTAADDKQQQEGKAQQEAAAPQQQQQGSAAPAPATTPDPGTTAAARRQEEEWTEVVDEKTGGVYFWNQSTGETTDLGEPRPKTRFRDQSWQQAAASGTPFQEGFREPPVRDRTYTYSMIGVVIGVSAGWFTQYLH